MYNWDHNIEITFIKAHENPQYYIIKKKNYGLVIHTSVVDIYLDCFPCRRSFLFLWSLGFPFRKSEVVCFIYWALQHADCLSRNESLSLRLTSGLTKNFSNYPANAIGWNHLISGVGPPLESSISCSSPVSGFKSQVQLRIKRRRNAKEETWNSLSTFRWIAG